MSNWSGGLLTAAGRALQAKVESGKVLNLTRLKLGDGAESASDIDTMIDLVSTKKTIGISSVEAEDGLCKVAGILSSADVTVGFYARELGLFAKDPDVGEILYMIALDSAPDFVPPNTSSVTTSAEYALNIAVSNISSVNVTINPNGLASVSALNKAACILQRSTDYALGNVLYDTQLAPGLYLNCIQAGRTGNTLLDLSQAKKGDIVTDGTVKWQIRAVTTCWDIDSDGNIVPSI